LTERARRSESGDEAENAGVDLTRLTGAELSRHLAHLNS